MREPTEEENRWSREVIGAAIEVHRTLGPGYVEAVYEYALEVEFQLRGIPFQRQVEVPISYKGRAVGSTRLDFLVGGCLVVELKALDKILPLHEAQVIRI